MSSSEKNIIFMGTPEFAVPVMELVHNELGVKAVVTAPDKAQGRGRKIISSAVKLKADELQIPTLQPEKLSDEIFINELKSFKPDIMLVVAFRILPPTVFNLSSAGTFNIHGSILPNLRGAAPINWAIINGYKRTGLTTFLIDRKVDTGNILLTDEFDIPENYTAGDLHDFMMPRASQIGLDTCKLLLTGNYEPRTQDHSSATPAPKLFPETSYINWEKSSNDVRNFIHGYSPIPGARTMWNNKLMKIFRVVLSDRKNLRAGEYLIQDNRFTVGCKEGSIEIIELQLEGKKKVDIYSFINGIRGESKGQFS